MPGARPKRERKHKYREERERNIEEISNRKTLITATYVMPLLSDSNQTDVKKVEEQIQITQCGGK